MSFRPAGLFVLALSLAVVVGCKRPQPSPPPAPPPKKFEEPPPKPEPKPAPPKPDEPIRLTLPEAKPDAKKDSPEPWVVGKAPEPTDFTPISFPNLAPLAVTGVSARPDIGRAVVTIRSERKGQPVGTRLALCDTAKGEVVTEWVVPGEYSAADLSPDGRMVLATAHTAKSGRNTLRLWIAGSDDQLQRWSWVPHTVPQNGLPKWAGREMTQREAVEVRWAEFVGNDRIVSMSKAGQLRVYDVEGPRLLATIDATPCRPAVTPDGTRVAFLAGENVALLDPAAARVVATRPLGPPPPYPAFAFSPDGARLAVGGNGKVLLADLATAKVEHVVLPKLKTTEPGGIDKSFGWAGERYLYSGQQLHDPTFPLPIWDYHGAEHGEFRGWQLWLCVRQPGTSTSTLRPYTLPHLDAQLHVTTAKARPGMFALKPGGGVRIDLTEIPGERRDEVKAALEARLKELGYVPDASASAVLFASVDPTGAPAGVTYAGHGSVPYTRRPAKLRLWLNGKDVWSDAWAISPPFAVSVPPKTTAAEVLAKLEVGEPNYDLFRKAPIPSFFPGPAAPPGSFGASDFTPAGFKDHPPR